MKIFIITLFVFSTISCGSNVKGVPEIFRPDWQGINTDKLPVTFGQIISFSIEGQNIVAMVLDFNNDEDGIWYGLNFINENKIFGRQIPNSQTGNCIDLLDLTYLNEKGLGEFQIIKNETVDINKIGIGAVSPASNYSEVLRDYNYGIEKRKRSQTPCNDNINMNPVHECYFDISLIR